MNKKLKELIAGGIVRVAPAMPTDFEITETEECFEITVPVAQEGRVPASMYYDTELNMGGCDISRGNDGNLPLGVVHSSSPEGRKRENIIGRVPKMVYATADFTRRCSFQEPPRAQWKPGMM